MRTGPTSSAPWSSSGPWSVSRSVYGESCAYAACMGTVSGSPRTQMNPASAGPAPPRRPGTPAPPVSSSTRTPSDCSSTSSWRSSRVSTARSATAGVQLLVVAPEDPLLELLRDRADPVDLPVLRVEVRPRLVRAEEHPVAADARLLDLGEQPAGPEADRPRGVGVDLVAVLHPLQELRDEPDVARHAAAEVHEVDLATLSVALDERDEVRYVRVAAGARMEVEDQVVLLADVEALVGDRASLVVPRARIGVAAEQEGRLQRHDPRVARQLQRLARHLRVARQERHPDRREDPVVRRRRLHHDVVEVERDLVHRHAVVRHGQCPLDLELVHVVLHELVRRAVVVDGRLHRVLEVVELPRRDLADVAVGVDDALRVRGGGHLSPFRRSPWPARCAPATPRPWRSAGRA